MRIFPGIRDIRRGLTDDLGDSNGFVCGFCYLCFELGMTYNGGFMKRWLMVGLLVLMGGSCWAASQNNSPKVGTPAAPLFEATDQRWVIRFSTVIPANQTSLVVGTMTAKEFVLAPYVAVSTGSAVNGITSSTMTTFGGRRYVSLQVTGMGTTQRVAWDFSSVDTSTTTSNLLSNEQYWSPDDPVTWQGPLYFKSTGPVTITGQIWMMQPRQN